MNMRILPLLISLALFSIFVNAETAPKPAMKNPLTLQTTKKWMGDLDGMKKRHMLRALVVYNQTNFFFDENGYPHGISYEAMQEFEDYLNRDIKRPEDKILVMVIPVRRDQLLSYLQQGKGDLVVASLSITTQRKKTADFSLPFYSGVKELLVTGPGLVQLHSLDDLSGKEIWVRRSSSYFDSLHLLNERLKKHTLAPVIIRQANEYLETEDLLEMVAAGIIDSTVADDYLADAWAESLGKVHIHKQLPLRKNTKIAWAFRKNSPLLANEVNAFVKQNKKGTLTTNVLINRYYGNNQWIKNASAKERITRSQEMAELFKKYAGQYDFNWLMITAQAYQESGLDHSRRSPAGAIGVMQLLESTANDKNVNVQNIDVLENNIHAGSKYLRFLVDRYFSNGKMDKFNQQLFAFASYNAGPARINQLRKLAAQEGLNPNIWFQNVEVIAGREIGRETVEYVRNILKYYVAYQLAAEQMQKRNEAAAAPKH
jgi:membrane-bound lytic murein transglycosylase MltF